MESTLIKIKKMDNQIRKQLATALNNLYIAVKTIKGKPNTNYTVEQGAQLQNDFNVLNMFINTAVLPENKQPIPMNELDLAKEALEVEAKTIKNSKESKQKTPKK